VERCIRNQRVEWLEQRVISSSKHPLGVEKEIEHLVLNSEAKEAFRSISNMTPAVEVGSKKYLYNLQNGRRTAIWHPIKT
jgi:hypothetical protein